jgi:23S rRNA (guanine745-N1)-methyltransferase
VGSLSYRSGEAAGHDGGTNDNQHVLHVSGIVARACSRTIDRLTAPLACPVRSCHLPLQPTARTWVCPNRHSFDIARSGYVNLLQPQDRRSPDAGDSAAAVHARRRLLAAGVGATIVEAFVARAAALCTDADCVIVDLGCGAGDVLGRLHARQPLTAVGLDLSGVAIDLAARRFPGITWTVANADRRLPLLDGSAALVLSLHARRNPPECHRVLKPGGHLLAAVPASDDLIELRTAVQGTRVERDRAADTIAEHAAAFAGLGHFTARERHTLAGDALRDLLRGTYRGERSSAAARVEALATLDVTLASDIILLRRR